MHIALLEAGLVIGNSRLTNARVLTHDGGVESLHIFIECYADSLRMSSRSFDVYIGYRAGWSDVIICTELSKDVKVRRVTF